MRAKTIKKTKLRGLSPQANYTDPATAACRRSRQLLWVEGVAWSAQRILTAVNLGFLDRSRYFFFQVAPQLSSRGWLNPVPDPLLLRKSGRVGNRTRDLWICSQKLWLLDHRGGTKIIKVAEIRKCWTHNIPNLFRSRERSLHNLASFKPECIMHKHVTSLLDLFFCTSLKIIHQQCLIKKEFIRLCLEKFLS
jgi:hypothetical protein